MPSAAGPTPPSRLRRRLDGASVLARRAATDGGRRGRWSHFRFRCSCTPSPAPSPSPSLRRRSAGPRPPLTAQRATTGRSQTSHSSPTPRSDRPAARPPARPRAAPPPALPAPPCRPAAPPRRAVSARGAHRLPSDGDCLWHPPPPSSRTDWTRLVPPPVLTGHASSLLAQRLPSDGDCLWRGEPAGQALAICVRPSDAHYRPGQYYVSTARPYHSTHAPML